MAKVRSSSTRLSSVRARTSSARKRSRSRWRCPVVPVVVAMYPFPLAPPGPACFIASAPRSSFLQDFFQGLLGALVAACDGVAVDAEQFGRLIIAAVTEVEQLEDLPLFLGQ